MGRGSPSHSLASRHHTPVYSIFTRLAFTTTLSVVVTLAPQLLLPPVALAQPRPPWPLSTNDSIGPDAAIARLTSTDSELRRGAVAWLRVNALSAHSTLPQSAQETMLNTLLTVWRREPDLSVRLCIIETIANSNVSTADTAIVDMYRQATRDAPGSVTHRALVRALGTALSNNDALEALFTLAHGSPRTGLPFGESSRIAADTLARLAPAELIARERRITHPDGDRSRQHRYLGIARLRVIAAMRDPRQTQPVLDVLRTDAHARSSSRLSAAIAAARTLALWPAANLLVDIALHSPVSRFRGEALAALASLDGAFDPALIAPLIASTELRSPALDLATTLAARSLRPVIEPVLDSRDRSDRLRAAEALAAIADPASLPSLITAINDTNDTDELLALWWTVASIDPTRVDRRSPAGRIALVRLALTQRNSVAEPTPGDDTAALWLRGERPQYPGVSRAERESPARQLTVAIAWGRAPTQTQKTLAETWLAHEDVEATRVALVGVLAAGEPDDRSLEALSALTRDERDAPSPAALAAATALVEHGAKIDREVLARWARSLWPPARSAALWCIGAQRETRLTDVVVRALHEDPDPGVRGSAAIALTVLIGRRALPHLDTVDQVAWTIPLIEQLSLARTRAVSTSAASPWHSENVRFVTGLAPGSVWLASLPDGRIRVGVATAEGWMSLPGVNPEAPLRPAWPQPSGLQQCLHKP